MNAASFHSCECTKPAQWFGRLEGGKSPPGFRIVAMCDKCKRLRPISRRIKHWVKCEEVYR